MKKKQSIREPIKFKDAIAVARLWLKAGGRPEVELGALEPLLWRDGKMKPPDLVRGLIKTGVRVTMTTNASKLEKYADALKEAGLSLLRISWHTTDADRFHEISGHGNYAVFLRGLEAAAKAELKISFNRVLLQNYVYDLPKQLEFINKHKLRLKLYDLMWTHEIANVYSSLYQDWRPVVRKYVIPITQRVERIGSQIGRQRLRFHLMGGGIVEVKLSKGIKRDNEPCVTCVHRKSCLEEFGDYLRVEPELNAYFCYLRRDVGLNLRELLKTNELDATLLQQKLSSVAGIRVNDNLKNLVLRYILVPFCNFNCYIPGTNISWCHKTTGNYSFPGRPPNRELPIYGQS